MELPCCELSNKVGKGKKHIRAVVLFHYHPHACGAGTSAQCRCDCSVILGPWHTWPSARATGACARTSNMIRREKQGKTRLCTELLPLPCADILNKNPICATLSPPAPPLTTVADPGGMVQQVQVVQSSSTYF